MRFGHRSSPKRHRPARAVMCAAAGAGDRLTARCTELLQAELPWVKNVRMELVRQEAAAKPTDVSALQQLAAALAGCQRRHLGG